MRATTTRDPLADDETRRSFLKRDALIPVVIGATLEIGDWCQEPKLGKKQE